MQYNQTVVEMAIEKLSIVVNKTTGLSNVIDESRAKALFKALHRHAFPLDYQTVFSLAIQFGWPEEHAATLAKVAEKIGSGGRVQIKHPNEWGDRTFDQILAELGSGLKGAGPLINE